MARNAFGPFVITALPATQPDYVDVKCQVVKFLRRSSLPTRCIAIHSQDSAAWLACVLYGVLRLIQVHTRTLIRKRCAVLEGQYDSKRRKEEKKKGRLILAIAPPLPTISAAPARGIAHVKFNSSVITYACIALPARSNSFLVLFLVNRRSPLNSSSPTHRAPYPV